MGKKIILSDFFKIFFEIPFTSLPTIKAKGNFGFNFVYSIAFLSCSKAIILILLFFNLSINLPVCLQYSNGIVFSAPSAVLEILWCGGCSGNTAQIIFLKHPMHPMS